MIELSGTIQSYQKKRKKKRKSGTIQIIAFSFQNLRSNREK